MLCNDQDGQPLVDGSSLDGHNLRVVRTAVTHEARIELCETYCGDQAITLMLTGGAREQTSAAGEG